MSLIPWRGKQRESGPGETSPLCALRTEIDRLFDSFVRGPFSGFDWPFGSQRGWLPAVDIAESDEEVTVRAEMPGIAPEDLEVTISGNQLVLAGEKKESTERSGKDFYQTESYSGSFRRSIPLPQAVDPDKVDAEYANGVLLIHLTKSAAAAAKQIHVKTTGEITREATGETTQ